MNTTDSGAHHQGQTPPFNIEGLRSFLPVDAIVKDGRPGIEWMDMSGVALSEPFFNQTVERVRSTRPEAKRLITDLNALIQLEKMSESVQPTGFVFHSSRCGSTLVANACRPLQGSLVISEA